MANLTKEQVLEKIRSGESMSGVDLSHIDLSGTDLKRSDLSNVTLTGANLQGADLGGAILNNADLTDAVLNGVNLKGATMKKASLANAKLQEAKMIGINLEKSNIDKADLNSSNLVYANLSGAVMTGVNLSDVNLMGANMANANLQGAKFGGTKLVYTNLQGANMEKVSLQGAILVGADLRNVQLIGANLKGVKLWGAKLAGAKLMSANLVGANLVGADLEDANMAVSTLLEANLLKANLEIANLHKVNLNNASLVEANLTGAKLSEASLDTTDLSRADLRGADLRYAQLSNCNLSGANITGVKIHGTVRCNIKCDDLVAENLDFSQDGDESLLRSLTKDELKDFFVKITPYLRLSINGEAGNQALLELSFYLDKIKSEFDNLDLNLKALESESGTSNLEFSIEDENNLYVAFFLVLECIRFCCEKNVRGTGWDLSSSFQSHDLVGKNSWSMLTSLIKYNSKPYTPQETQDFLSMTSVRRIEIHTSNGKRFSFLISPDGKLSIDFNSGDTDSHVIDFIKHLLTSSTSENIEDQIYAFDHFYNDFLSDEKSLLSITQRSRDIAQELKKSNIDLSNITSSLNSCQDKSASAKAVLNGLNSI
jgi:uncharacterized protein YjbI with pentapeptide repeats